MFKWCGYFKFKLNIKLGFTAFLNKKCCQGFIPNFHPFLIVLKCTVCLLVLFDIYNTGKC